MKFKIDENLPQTAAALLIGEGCEADTVFQEQLTGISDVDLAALCLNEDRVLITLDQGFGDIRAYPPNDYPGLIVLRLTKQDKDNVVSILRRAIDLLKDESLYRKLWIVESHRVRVRE